MAKKAKMMRVTEDRSQEARVDGKASLSDFIEKVRGAFTEQHRKQLPNGSWIECWVSDVYEDQIVADMDSTRYLISFEMKGGKPEFAPMEKWVKVERSWVPVTEALRLLASVKTEGQEPEGREWEVVIIGPEQDSDLVTEGQDTYIRSKNGRYYRVSALEASAPMWNGIKVYDNHLTDAQLRANQGMRSVVKEWVGVIENTAWDAARNAVTGTLKIVDEALRTKLLNAEKAKVLKAIGLSIDALGEGKEMTIGGVKAPVVTKISRALSVDVVADPAAGGRLSRMIAGTHPLQTTESQMEDTPMNEEELKKLIESLLGTRLQALTTDLEGKISQIVKEAMSQQTLPAQIQAPAGDTIPAAVKEALEKAEALVKDAEERARRANCAEMLGRKLQESGLPASVRTLLSKRFAGKTFEEKDLDAEIAEQKEALMPLVESGSVRLPEGARISGGGLNEWNRHELAFLRLVAGPTRFEQLATKENALYHSIEALQRYVEDGKPALPRATRLSEWYYGFTEDYDGIGRMQNPRFLEANVTTTSMASIVKNAVNLLLAADYSAREQWWDRIVRQEDVDTLDQATLVRVYGISNLAALSEGDAYTEASWADEEETAVHQKRGNFIGVTLETFLTDKLARLRSLPTRLSNAFYNTISALVSSVFTLNAGVGPTLGDGGALFNNTAANVAGGHANLLTGALDMTNWGLTRNAMMKQTDQVLGAGRRLMVQPRYLLVPVDLETVGLQIRNSEYIPGSPNNDVNPYYQKFDVVPVPDWTDVTDWATVADPAVFPAIWLIWLRGRRTPEIYSAEDERGGAMFTNDELRFKVRQFTFQKSAAEACAPVSDFRPLHKNNVAG